MGNPPSPVSRLPPELLAKTFKYLVIHSSPTILLQICHRWADIASSISSLWFRVDFSTPPAPLLQSCVNQPIEVILPSSPAAPTSNQLGAVKEVLLHSDRIRKLVLDLPADHLRAIEPELSGAFPILVDVSISVKRNRYKILQFDELPEWRPIAIPLPPIRYLRLSFVETPWILGRFQNLVEFFLHDQRIGFDPTMEISFGILELSPSLLSSRWQMPVPGCPSTLPSSLQPLVSSILIIYSVYISNKKTRVISGGC